MRGSAGANFVHPGGGRVKQSETSDSPGVEKTTRFFPALPCIKPRSTWQGVVAEKQNGDRKYLHLLLATNYSLLISTLT